VYVGFGMCTFRKAAATILIGHLANNVSVTHLFFSNNTITADTDITQHEYYGMFLLPLIVTNTSLIYLHITGEYDSYHVLWHIVSALRSNSTIMYFTTWNDYGSPQLVKKLEAIADKVCERNVVKQDAVYLKYLDRQYHTLACIKHAKPTELKDVFRTFLLPVLKATTAFKYKPLHLMAREEFICHRELSDLSTEIDKTMQRISQRAGGGGGVYTPQDFVNMSDTDSYDDTDDTDDDDDDSYESS
jgi:hypothetical protein